MNRIIEKNEKTKHIKLKCDKSEEKKYGKVLKTILGLKNDIRIILLTLFNILAGT